MRIENPELQALLEEMSADERRIAELFAQALGENHVLNSIKRNKESFSSLKKKHAGKSHTP